MSFFLVPVAWALFFLLVVGVLVAGVGEAEVFLFWFGRVCFLLFFLPLLLRVPVVSPPF